MQRNRLLMKVVVVWMSVSACSAGVEFGAEDGAAARAPARPPSNAGLVCEDASLFDAALQIALALCGSAGAPEDVEACKAHAIVGYCQPEGACDAQLCGSAIANLAACLDGIALTGDVVPACGQVFEAAPPAPPPSSPVTMTIHASAAASRADGIPAPVFDGSSWLLGTSLRSVRYPVPALVGDHITGATVYVHKNSTSGTVTAQLHRHIGLNGAHDAAGVPVTNSQSAPGVVMLTISGLDEYVDTGDAFAITVTGGGVDGDRALNAEVSALRPLPVQ